MDASNPEKHKNIIVSGPVVVECVDEVQIPALVFLLLGPTGPGKSTFVEAIAKDPSLRISSGQLEGCTQSISTYRLGNVAHEGDPIYLVDVPGFGDTKISEMNVVYLLRDWMIKNDVHAFTCILYLVPINITRFPGSHMQVLRTFESLTGVKAAPSITIVSTMWDSVWSDLARDRAERNFSQLRDEIFQPFIAHGSQVVKFLNTQHSALSAIDTALNGVTVYDYHLETFVNNSQLLQQTPFGHHLHHGLQVRIQNLQSQQAQIKCDMDDALERSDEQLMDVLIPELEGVETYLEIFKQEMGDVLSSPHLSSVLNTLVDLKYEWDIAGLLLPDLVDRGADRHDLAPSTSDPRQPIATDPSGSNMSPPAAHEESPLEELSIHEEVGTPPTEPQISSNPYIRKRASSNDNLSFHSNISLISCGPQGTITAYQSQPSAHSLQLAERVAARNNQGGLARVKRILKWWLPSRWRAI